MLRQVSYTYLYLKTGSSRIRSLFLFLTCSIDLLTHTFPHSYAHKFIHYSLTFPKSYLVTIATCPMLLLAHSLPLLLSPPLFRLSPPLSLPFTITESALPNPHSFYHSLSLSFAHSCSSPSLPQSFADPSLSYSVAPTPLLSHPSLPYSFSPSSLPYSFSPSFAHHFFLAWLLSLSLCHHCLPNFSLPSSFAHHVMFYSITLTLYHNPSINLLHTPSLFSHPSLSLACFFPLLLTTPSLTLPLTP